MGLASLIPSIPFAPLTTFSTLGSQAAAQGYVPSHLPTGISDNSDPTFQYYYGQSGLLINALFPGFGITLAAPALPTAPNSPPFLSPVGPPVNNAIPLQFQGLGSPAVGINIGQPTDTFGQTTGFYNYSTGLQIHNTINFSDPAQPPAANPSSITTTFNLPPGATTPTIGVSLTSGSLSGLIQTGPGAATGIAVSYNSQFWSFSVAAQNNIGIFTSLSVHTLFGTLDMMVPIQDSQHHHPTIHFRFNMYDLFFRPDRR